MGNTSSSTNTNSFSQKLASIALSAATNCASAINTTQLLDLSGTGNFLFGSKQMIHANVDLSCLQKTSFLADLKTKLAAAVVAESEATGQQVSLSNTSSEANIATTQLIEDRIDLKFVAKMGATMNATQAMKLSGSGNIVINPEQSATLTEVGNLINETLSGVKAYDEIVSTQDAKSKATTENMIAGIIESVGKMFEGMMSWIKWLVIGFIAVILIGITAKFMMSDTKTITSVSSTTPAQTSVVVSAPAPVAVVVSPAQQVMAQQTTLPQQKTIPPLSLIE